MEDIWFNTAGQGFHHSEPYTDFQRTVDVCAFTLETVRREVPDCRFILLSSAAVYGNPTQLPVREHSPVEPVSPYGYHKRMCETLVDEYRTLHCISAVVLRIFSAYGERLRRQVVFDLCRKFNNPGSDVVEVYGTGQESRDFIHATDVAQAISCIVLGNATGYFNLGSGKQTTIANLVNQIKKSMNSDKDIHFTGQIRPGDPLCWEADINQLKSLGFSPSITLDAGIKKYCDWFKLDYF
jgi:UDP-glucose 4-epimerase